MPPRSPALKRAQKAYEAKRNARKVLLRLSEEEAAFVDKLGPALGKFDATREQGIRELIRNTMEEWAEAERKAKAAKKQRR
jgi:hypothetical protein